MDEIKENQPADRDHERKLQILKNGRFLQEWRYFEKDNGIIILGRLFVFINIICLSTFWSDLKVQIHFGFL